MECFSDLGKIRFMEALWIAFVIQKSWNAFMIQKIWNYFMIQKKLEYFQDLEKLEFFYELEKMEFFYDLEKSWNTFMIYKIYSILINSIFYYNPMREIEEENGRIHGEWSRGRGREYFKHASRDE